MERDRLERQIREKLEQRRITPAASAWDRLEQQLESRPASSPRHKRASLFAVASAVGIVVLGLLLWEKRPERATVPAVVSAPETGDTVPVNTESKERQVKNGKTETEVAAAEKPASGRPEPVREQHFETGSVPVYDPVKDTGQQAVVQAEETGKREKEDEKVAGVVSKLLEINKEREVTDEDIEMMLAHAQREIAAERLQLSDSGSVDAMALLDEVEAEIDRSFREKVLEALKDGLARVGTALADRN
ncbi:hypothetical protein [Sinomicrobium soli]|uniref:hypothetical protein n=1 Tax=Sinomicrobium sp. N-1-3-6 TaxID=2219864 RepID=UPI000DCD0932|nr:hypothetical protein [Sinomicrobium sp. N-1-3-6]RAV30706.1 hypothetical protein DN748_00125 [Sinomicrobium sp. N-1-3-6]